jgi:lysophospholipase L1-like esterase
VDEECLRVLDAIEAVPDLYDRRPVTLTDSTFGDVHTYVYQRSVDGMSDCGTRWTSNPHASQSHHAIEVVYLADLGRHGYDQDRLSVDIVCAGDSLTGWNNHGSAHFWPFPTYPRFLQELCEPSGLRVADGGIAGEVSDNGTEHVRHYLELFPNSRYFVIGFGTNDLGTWPDVRSTSARIIRNLAAMVEAVRSADKQPMLFNVPYVNESLFVPSIAAETHDKRDYHNARLLEWCRENNVPLADICSHLRNEHLGDELHPNAEGAKIIAQRVFAVLTTRNRRE